jgi:DnaJ-class molecular chaperone
MKTIQKIFFVTSDDKEFEDESKAQFHQDILDGKKKYCKKCSGKGKFQNSFSHGYTDEFTECESCEGKGYFEWKLGWS